jgi:TonB family protein
MKVSIVLGFFLLLFLTSFMPGEDPSFKGGSQGLRNFINENLIYPHYSRQNCIQGTIEVSFRLGSAGVVKEARVSRGFGIDLDDEALRLIKLTSGNWRIPVEYDTTSTITIPINFSLRNLNCWKSEAEVKAAIDAYKAQQFLSDAVVTYYENKDKGGYDEAAEQKIAQLKEQLGYNDEYIGRIIDQAKEKIEKGDKEGACQDLQFVKKIGSDRANKLINENCQGVN